MQDVTAEDDPTGESTVLDAGLVAGSPADPVADDSVVDPNVLALRRVDVEIRRLMESWVELENQLHSRDSEILRLRGWASGLEEDVRATRQELGAARSDCERLRGEASEQRAEVDSQRRRAEARGAEAESLRTDLGAAQTRLNELTAEVRLGRENTEQLTSRLAEHRDALAGMAARLRQAEKSSQGLDSEKAELAARIADAEQRCAELSGRYRDSEAARRQAEKDVPAAARRARDLEVEVEKARESAAKIQRKLEEKVVAIESLEAAAREHERARTDLTAQIRKAEEALSAAQRDAAAAGTMKMAELQSKLDAERARAVALGGEIRDREQTIVELKAALDNQRQKTEMAENRGSRAEELLQEARARVAALEAERAQLLAGMQELRDQAAAVDNEFQAKRKAIAVLGNEIDRLGLIQANVRKLDNMMNEQLLNQGPVPPADEKPRNDRLIVWLDGTSAVKYPLYKPDMVIGRSRASDIRVTGSRTSRRHAHIFVEDGAVFIEDLGSLNGITVNSESVCRKQLHDGDVLDVGGARLRYVDLDERAAAYSREAMAAN